MPATLFIGALVALQVSVTPGVLRPSHEVKSSHGLSGTPSDASVARVEAAFQHSRLRKSAASYPDRYFWSDPGDASVTRYLYISMGGDTVPGVHIIRNGEQPRVFDGGCWVISGEDRLGEAPTFRCNNSY